MSTIIPKGEKTRRAVKWISEQSKNSDKDTKTLVASAISMFDLNPFESETLYHFYKDTTNSSE